MLRPQGQFTDVLCENEGMSGACVMPFSNRIRQYLRCDCRRFSRQLMLMNPHRILRQCYCTFRNVCHLQTVNDCRCQRPVCCCAIGGDLPNTCQCMEHAYTRVHGGSRVSWVGVYSQDIFPANSRTRSVQKSPPFESRPPHDQVRQGVLVAVRIGRTARVSMVLGGILCGSDRKSVV